MDDRDLEARLRSHLHATLDDAKPSPELAAAVRDRMASATAPVRLDGTFLRRQPTIRFGFALAAAAVVVIALALSGTIGRGPSSGGQSPSPAASAGDTTRSFIVLPPTAAIPSKADSTVASNAMEHRLQALGVGTFSGGGGYGIEWEIPAGGPSDADIRAVLAAPGVATFVLLPAADYPPGSPVTIGQPLPKAEPDWLGDHAIATVREATDNSGNPALNITLSFEVAPYVAQDTANHIGDQFALLLDGRVVTTAIIQGAITDGQVQITSAGAGIPATTRAILIGGVLPPAWRNAWVPELISRDAAVTTALAEASDSALVSVDLEARLIAAQWRPVWAVRIRGTFGGHCGLSASPCLPGSEIIVLVDAVHDGAISFENASP